MSEPSDHSLIEGIRAELRRVGLDPAELTGLAIAGGDASAFLAHLRGLRAGASWSDAFPGTPRDWRPGIPAPERPLGPFDYAEPPRGPAVFASVDADSPADAASHAIARVRSLGHPVYGSGIVLDRGAPHLYVVLNRDASEDDLFAVVECLRVQPGIANAFPERWGDGS